MYKKLSFLFFVFCCYASPSLAKVKPHAQAKKVLAHIKTPSNFQADFIYSRQEKDAEEPQQIQGKVCTKGNKYKIALDEQIIISNGEVIWNYLPTLHEVHINNFEAEDTAALFSPTQLMHIYQQGFIPIALKIATIDKAEYDIVELIASDQENFIKHLSLTIGKESHQIKNMNALDSNGTIHSFIMINLVSGMDVENSYFEFDATKYKDLEIVDLR
jgi:outer membrane lipoprotein-sorting protein